MPLLDDNVSLLVVPSLWVLRVCFFVVDALAAGCYEGCFMNCLGLFPPPIAPTPSLPPHSPPLPPISPPRRPPRSGAEHPPQPPGMPPPLLPFPTAPPPLFPLEPPERSCEGLLSAIAALNLFSITAFALLVGVRCVTPERSFSEACIVTYVLVGLDVLLKLGDATLPIALTVHCFPESAVLGYNSSLISSNCAVPCLLGDLFAIYGLYGVSKCAVGIMDIVLATPFLLAKPRHWYRWGSSRLK